jgi:Dolichyl-phosphate-mannose-protein mannosyltransferase
VTEASVVSQAIQNGSESRSVHLYTSEAVMSVAAPEALSNSTVWRRRLVSAAGPVVLILVSFILVGLHVVAYTKVSPIDELQHIDYLYKSPAIVVQGEQIGQDALREEACRGLDYDFKLPACTINGTYNAREFQENGYNTAAINSPVYYTLTHGAAWAVQRVFGLDSLVTAGRLVGGLWLGLGLCIAFAAGRRLGISRLPLTASLALVASAPSVLLFSSTITPDAMTLGVGAATLWTLLWWEANPGRRWPALAAVVVFAMLVKQTNVLVIGAAIIYLLLRYLVIRRQQPVDPPDIAPNLASVPPALKAYLGGAAVIVVATAVTFVGWASVYSQQAPPADVPMNLRFQVDSFPIGPWLGSFGQMLETPESQPPGPGSLNLKLLGARLVRICLLTGLVALAVFANRLEVSSRMRSLARAAVIGAIVGAPMLILLNYVTTRSFFTIPDRYGYSLLAAMALSVAALALRRVSVIALISVASAAIIVSGLRMGLA